MSEAVAKVVRDIRTGRCTDPSIQADDPGGLPKIHRALIEVAKLSETQVVDATPMFDQMMADPKAVDLYEDVQILPVWENALIGLTNNFGNTFVVQCYTIEEPLAGEAMWETDNPVDWDAVKYRFAAFLWVGGRSQGKPVPTVGPVYRWDIAAYEDGAPADIHWQQIFELPGNDGPADEGRFRNVMLTWLQTFTLAGCTNVELVTPQRSKPERKRIARLGVNPQTIVIKRTSKSYRHDKDDTADVIGGVPQSFVRGHFAKYGMDGRGLLFGKYSGRYWIPAHARGSNKQEEREIDYRIES